MSDKLRVLGLDPASVKFGYGCIDVVGARLVYVDCGVLKAKAKDGPYSRLVEIGRDLEELIGELKPDVVAIEAGFVKGQMGALVSGAARGVAAYIAGRRGLDVREYAPASVKLAATGYGNASKAQVAVLMRLRFCLAKLPSEDAADALAVAVKRAHDR